MFLLCALCGHISCDQFLISMFILGMRIELETAKPQKKNHPKPEKNPIKTEKLPAKLSKPSKLH